VRALEAMNESGREKGGKRGGTRSGHTGSVPPPPPPRSIPPPEPRLLHILTSGAVEKRALVSFVIAIKQTNHSTNSARPCTTALAIKKGLSICQSSASPDLERCPVLGQIKPHTPHLVVTFRQCF